MEVSQVGNGLFDPFPVKVKKNSQHTMGTGVLGPHVEEELLCLDRGVKAIQDSLAKSGERNFPPNCRGLCRRASDLFLFQ